MNLMARQDRVLLGGLAVALFVVFARPIRYLLDLARAVEESSGLALVPALIILTAVFLFHQQGKRHEAKARAAAARADALQSEARALEMERLVIFGQGLGRALEMETIRDVVLHDLPRLAGTDQAWVLLWEDGHWKPLVGTASESREVERASSATDSAIRAERGSQGSRPRAVDEHDRHDAPGPAAPPPR